MVSFDIGSRSRQDELMDTEEVDFEEFRGCLRDLERVNRLTLAYRPTLAFFASIRERAEGLGRPLRVVDVGSGYGDMLRRVAAFAREAGIDVALTGVDLNPWSRRAAVESTPAGYPIRWVTTDAFTFEPEEGIDVVISSLFTHHLPDSLVVRFLAWMEATARLGWFVSDLHRHPLPFHFFRYFARLARFHRFVQHDGPVSIARAFSADDWRGFLHEAAIDPDDVAIEWHVPFRLTVARTKLP